MENLIINEKKYILVTNEKEGYNQEEVEKIMTDYFEEFDVVVGDWSYGKLRLKGFNDEGHKNFKSINDSSKIAEYIEKNCAFGCRWFAIRANKD